MAWILLDQSHRVSFLRSWNTQISGLNVTAWHLTFADQNCQNVQPQAKLTGTKCQVERFSDGINGLGQTFGHFDLMNPVNLVGDFNNDTAMGWTSHSTSNSQQKHTHVTWLIIVWTDGQKFWAESLTAYRALQVSWQMVSLPEPHYQSWSITEDFRVKLKFTQ